MDQQSILDEQNEISLKDIIRIISSRKWWLFLTFLIVVSLVGVYLYRATPVYQASATLWIEPSQSGSSFEDLFAIQTGGSSTKIATEVEIIKSRRNLEKMIEELDLINIYTRKYEYKTPLTVDRLISQINGLISVSTVKDTNIVRISVENDDYLLARDMANTLAVVYNNLLKDLAQNDFSIRREFIESQIGPAAANVVDAENKLREFKEENGIFLLDEEAKVLLEYITSYEQQIDPYRIQKSEAQNKQAAFVDSIKEAGGAIVPYQQITADPELKDKISELTDARLELIGYSEARAGDAFFTSTRSDELKTSVMRLENEIKAKVMELVLSAVEPSSASVYLKNYYAQLANAYTLEILADVSISYLTQLKNSYEAKMLQLPALEQKLLDLKRDVSVKENLYLLLLQNYEEAKIAEAAVTGTSTIIDKAIANDVPIKPNKQMMLAVGVLLGLFLGVLVVFLLEAFDDSVKDEDTIKRAVGGDLPIIGRIPHLQIDPDEPYDELVVYNGPTSPAAEAYKLIATNILYSNVEASKVICVSSAEMGVGKTSISANTAIAMAQNGLKTLLIDADMRKPRLEKAFGLERETNGLVNNLLQDIALEKLIRKPLEDMPDLHLLPVGPLPPNPTALIASDKFRAMLNELRRRYDRIVIDLPPLLAASDGLIIGRDADGVILVVRMGTSSKHGLRMSGESLANAKIPMLGLVVNDITRGNSYSYYNYYYYYNMSGDKISKKKRFRNKYKYGSYRTRSRSRYHTAEEEKGFASAISAEAVVVPEESGESEKSIGKYPDSMVTKTSKDYLSELETEELKKMSKHDIKSSKNDDAARS